MLGKYLADHVPGANSECLGRGRNLLSTSEELFQRISLSLYPNSPLFWEGGAILFFFFSFSKAFRLDFPGLIHILLFNNVTIWIGHTLQASLSNTYPRRRPRQIEFLQQSLGIIYLTCIVSGPYLQFLRDSA